MNPSKIRLCDESFVVFPSSIKTERNRIFREYKDEIAVFILPSLKEDFKIEAYKNSKPLIEYYTSAVSAAFYLIDIMGLPLPEISFETPKGRVEIINTDPGVFSFKAEKCKLLFSKSEEVRGCSIEFFDFLFLKNFRVLLAKKTDLFSPDVLPDFSFLGESAASVVAIFSEEGGENLFYSPFNEEITSFIPHLFRAFIFGKPEPLRSGDTSFAFSFDEVSASARPTII